MLSELSRNLSVQIQEVATALHLLEADIDHEIGLQWLARERQAMTRADGIDCGGSRSGVLEDLVHLASDTRDSDSLHGNLKMIAPAEALQVPDPWDKCFSRPSKSFSIFRSLRTAAAWLQCSLMRSSTKRCGLRKRLKHLSGTWR